MALSAQTTRLITKLISAAKDDALKGSAPPEEREQIQLRLYRSRENLEEHLLDLL